MAQTRRLEAQEGDVISKNYKLGPPVESIDEIIQLAQTSKAIFMRHVGLYMPAARLIYYHTKKGNIFWLYNLIQSKNFYFKLQKIEKE